MERDVKDGGIQQDMLFQNFTNGRDRSHRSSSVLNSELRVGSCLRVRAYLGDTPITVILDSGAGVSIIGRGFIRIFEKTLGYPPPKKPISLTIAGVKQCGQNFGENNYIIYPKIWREKGISRNECGGSAGMERRGATRMERFERDGYKFCL